MNEEPDTPSKLGAPETGRAVQRVDDEATANKRVAEIIVEKILDPKSLLKDALFGFARLYDKNPRAFGLTAAALLAAVFIARGAGVDLLWFAPQLVHLPPATEQLPFVRDITWIGNLSAYRECIAKSKALSRKYVLLNVLQLVQYENSPTKDQRVVEQRIIYTVLPLVDIAVTDQVFAEDYQGSGSVIRWYGPRRETLIPGTSRYLISFSGEKGIPLSIVTGARMLYPLPFATNRPAFRQKLSIAADQDFWAYENTADVICEITQIVDSRSLKLVPIGRGGYRIGEDGQAVEGDVTLHPPGGGPISNTALAATWHFVLPGQDVGVVFGW